jgi:protochlorophyllide reductase
MMRFVTLCLSLLSVGSAFSPLASLAPTARSVATIAGRHVSATTSAPVIDSTSAATTYSYCTTQLNMAVLEQTELPEKLYIAKEKEMPKVLGGLKIGLRQLVVITGASSGLGLYCAATLAKSGRYFVVMAVRDLEKAKTGKRETLSLVVVVCFSL